MEEKIIKIRSEEKIIKLISGREILYRLKEFLPINNGIFVLSNDYVWELWGKKLEEALDKAFTPLIIKDGERYKNIKTIQNIYNFLAEKGATRGSLLIAFGGGVVGDLGGFVASTYHRGMKLIHIPTTLLSMVDSSIGGKTGFNLRFGKNLVGSFYQPELILTDISLLTTLDDKEYLSGMAEVIKAGLIADKSLFNLIAERSEGIIEKEPHLLTNLVSTAQEIKIKVVCKDEKESGLRAILNFGHTLGHALEKLANWKIKHGFAVAKGLAFESYLSFLKGYLNLTKTERIIKTLKCLGYDLKINPSEELTETFYYDKKRRHKEVEWVLLKDIGKAVYGETVDKGILKEAISSYNGFLKG